MKIPVRSFRVDVGSDIVSFALSNTLTIHLVSLDRTLAVVGVPHVVLSFVMVDTFGCVRLGPLYADVIRLLSLHLSSVKQDKLSRTSPEGSSCQQLGCTKLIATL